MGTIRGRLIATYLLIALVTLAVLGTSLHGMMRRYFAQLAGETLLRQATEVARAVAERPRLQSEDSPWLLSRLISNLTSASFVVTDRDGIVQAGSLDTAGLLGTRFLPHFVTEALASGVNQTSQFSDPVAGQPAVAVAVPVRQGQRVTGAVVLFRPVLAIQVATRRMVYILALAGGVAVAAAAIMSYVMSVSVSRPLAELGKAARDIARGELDRRVAGSGSGDEVSELVDNFNFMAGRIAGLMGAASQERARLGAVLASVGHPLVAVDGDGVVLFMNSALARLCGTPEGEAVGRPLESLVPAPLMELLAKSPAQPGGWEEEFDWPGQDVYLVRATALAAPGAGHVLVFQDLSQERRLDRMRREFVSMISHELRTPVTSIQGFLEALSDGVVTDAEDQRHYLGVIAAETRRLSRLIDDLFEFARLELGQLDFRWARVDVGELVRSVLESAGPGLARRRLQVALDVTGSGLEVNGDGDRLAQVMWNLLANAMHFSPPGGSITVLAHRDDDRVSVSVTDTGPGIPQADLPFVFDRFYRSAQAKRHWPGGLGLGLTIARAIVEAHCGSMQAESREGEGTTITFTIPACC